MNDVCRVTQKDLQFKRQPCSKMRYFQVSNLNFYGTKNVAKPLDYFRNSSRGSDHVERAVIKTIQILEVANRLTEKI